MSKWECQEFVNLKFRIFRAPCLAFINSQKSQPLTYTKMLMPCLNLRVILPYSIGYCGCEIAPGDMFAVILPY